jgi:glycosyltransferase involved in cell wall biosynthesis
VRTLLSVGWSCPIPPPNGVDVYRRPIDWGLTGWRKRAFVVRSTLALVVRARRYERVVLVTGGIELFLLAALLPRSKSLVAVDWLIPRSRALDRFGLLRRVRFVVVRRSDASTLLDRFGAADTRFAAFPASKPSGRASEGAYVYSAGWAHRDWRTLLAALRETGFPAVISTGEHLEASSNVRIVNQLPPEEGREYLRGARCVALTFIDTTLPSGPLVLLDAMAHGKAIVVSDVGGSRDYVDDDQEALVVPPGDVVELVAALRRIWSDASLRKRLGNGARARVAGLTAEAFWAEVLG